ncbi:MAG: protein kinase, partial [Cyanobacteria bacterium J06648_11]
EASDVRRCVEFCWKEIESSNHPKHPNVMEILGLGWKVLSLYPNEGWVPAFVIMELAAETLAQKIENSSAGLTPEKLDILVQTLRGLSHLHTHEIMHRDLKPENVLRSQDGSIKLGDLGLSRLLKDISEGRLKTKVGTPKYMAPEVDSQRYTYSADVWSVALIALELIFAELPDYRDEQLEMLQTQIRLRRQEQSGKEEEVKREEEDEDEEGKVEELIPILDDPAADLEVLFLLERCLNLEPSARPSARELLVFFERLLCSRSSKVEDKWRGFVELSVLPHFVSQLSPQSVVLEAASFILGKIDSVLSGEGAGSRRDRAQQIARIILALSDVLLALMSPLHFSSPTFSEEPLLAQRDRLQEIRMSQGGAEMDSAEDNARFSEMSEAEADRFLLALKGAREEASEASVFFLTQLHTQLKGLVDTPEEHTHLAFLLSVVTRGQLMLKWAFKSTG